MKMIPVASSAILAIGYDRSTRRMRIQFVEGNTYSFCHVPEVVFDAFLKSPSKGTFYTERIRGNYNC